MCHCFHCINVHFYCSYKLRYFCIDFTDYIKRNITAFWTGASDADIEGIWKWMATDSELLYTAWNADGCQRYASLYVLILKR
jgi:hypothetical protein